MLNEAFSALGGTTIKQPHRKSCSDIELVRLGLTADMLANAMTLTGLSRRELETVLGVKLRLYDKLLPAIATERVLMLISLIQAGTEYFGTQDKMLLWLKTPNQAFANQQPITLLDTTIGIDMINATITKLSYGMTA
ncbi:antitoxin Xre/MbcA/ParS toxin-binding domain-containing protein [Shewanella sp. TB4-MNA-CIBAN-0142]|uniref:antitoxin Xre/MbcA/ParS toxin-binding domain-containing protein n=1 Tax=Shewanella sp. TB4-MNA-CIBAN-0142 TaxID=3140464 RepID=UPI0033215231